MYYQLTYRISLFLETEVSLVALHKLDRDTVDKLPSLWKWMIESQASSDSIIKAIWEPVEKLVSPGFIQNFVSRCFELVIAVPAYGNLKPLLCYLYSTSHYSDLSAWVAGQPALDDDRFKIGNNQETFPNSYAIFTSVHNGFSVEGNGGVGLWPRSQVSLLPNVFIQEDLGGVKTASVTNRLLAFASHTDGDIQCYNLDLPVDKDFQTVRWDHEGKVFFHPEPFWSYLERFVLFEMSLNPDK